jgi:Ion transport protein
MLIITIVSSVQLGIDNPLNDPESRYSKVIVIIDYTLTAIFGLEAALKIIGNGFLFCGNRSYLRDGTNILDLLLVIVTVRISPILYYFVDNFVSGREQPEFN